MVAALAAQQIHDYSPSCDIAAMALCYALGILIFMSQIKKDQRLLILYGVIIQVFLGAVSHIIAEREMMEVEPTFWKVYVFRIVHHVMLSFIMLMYSLYLYEPLWIAHIVQRRNMIASTVFIIFGTFTDICGSIFGYGFRILDNGEIQKGFNAYPFVYLLMVGQIYFFIIKYRSRLIRQVFWSLLGLNIISTLLLVMQQGKNSQSYTTIAYLIPVIGILFLFHSNPFDVVTGAASESYLTKELSDCVARNRKLFIIVCRIRGFSDHITESESFRKDYYVFLRNNVKKGVLYHFTDGKLVLTMKPSDAKPETIEKILSDFEVAYQRYRIEYKVILLENDQPDFPTINTASDYLHLLEYAEEEMGYNTIRRISKEDVNKYYSSQYILSELEDIASKNNLNDPRVLVYCQPVYNLQTRKYDTAEALMRLNLEKTGLVFPDQFIPLAEQHNLIHALTLIILDKTCAAIHDLISEGYEFQRASVNFTVADLRYTNFCREVKHIIDRNEIPYDCIAIEITESQSDADFQTMKDTITTMQTLGIKFYLDDFGTGYSNFERIMELPFDIIKFDRSLLLEYAKSENSRYMVSTFAKMFHNLQYSVLFEGVENELDEQNCIGMDASYLQGYKYSRPIPINELRRFLHRAAHA